MTAPPASTPHASHRAARPGLHAFLRALADGALIGSFFELRERHGQMMRRRFYPTEFPDRAVSAILRAGRNRDVYIGAAPRARTHGGRAAIASLTTVWIDADTPDAIAQLDAFTPAPSILVATGRGRHAYWLLKRPVDVDTGEHANLRLAHHLAADTSCFDAARILRPPHSTNFQHQPPRPVRLLRLAASERHVLASITDGLPALAEDSSATRATRAPRDGRAARSAVGDPLLELEPAFYVSALLGVPIGRDRKVSCPFHADEHPSLHVYPTAAQGWHCFSCRRGGTVYDLAGELTGMQTRGVQFLHLRALLRERLLGRVA
jgi:CHC2 zinc finger/RepB DNA-primase from phage plasmid